MFLSVEIIGSLIFIMVIGMFVFTIVGGFVTWNKNNQSPRLNVNAQVVSKRTNTTRHNHIQDTGSDGAQQHHPTSSTHYFVTFQLDSGERTELNVSGRQYGLLAEGDTGKLLFQGTRYLDFVRDIS